jgi:uncharacterized protein YndB with AHSA1/START domain
MLTTRMTITFDVPIEQVWAVLSDYAGYARFPGVTAARVLKAGHDHPAGVGAMREVSVAGTTFVEEIVEFEPPHMLAYKIVESRPIKIVHDIGRMRLTARGRQTDLDWTTTATVGIPLIGGLLAYPMRFMIHRTFMQILHWLKDDLERAARAHAPAERAAG